MKKIIIITLTLVLTSCGSTYDFSTDYRIKSILTITEAGDTLAVPVRDFKFRILDRRIIELIDRDPFRYQYRQNWFQGNYNSYPIPNYNHRNNYNKPNLVKPKPNNPQINIRPIVPSRPSIITPMGVKPTIKPPNKNKDK
tara:strand:- start:355 stop:774 length:420 start_codon:yes stop_codon:yes gene_type:complete